MQVQQLLFTQGFGNRRACAGLVWAGQLRIGGRLVEDPGEEVDPQGLVFSVAGRDWPYHQRALLMMNKPAGYECSRKPRHHPGVLSLLPEPLRTRGVQPVGRLDEDTTGLLLLTDDGALIHRLTSPKHHVPKVYEVATRHALDAEQLQRLLAGVVLDDDPQPVSAEAAEQTAPNALRPTTTRPTRSSGAPTWRTAIGAGSTTRSVRCCCRPRRRRFRSRPRRSRGSAPLRAS